MSNVFYDTSQVPEGLLQQGLTSPAGNSPSSTAPKENQRREAGGRLIRNVLLNSDARHSQSSTAVQPHQKIQILNSESGKRPPRPVNARLGPNGLVAKNETNSFGSEGDTKRTADDKFTKKDLQGLGNVSEKQEKRTRNRDRPDRGVWTPLRRSDVSHTSDENLSSSMLHPTRSQCDSVEGTTNLSAWIFECHKILVLCWGTMTLVSNHSSQMQLLGLKQGIPGTDCLPLVFQFPVEK